MKVHVDPVEVRRDPFERSSITTTRSSTAVVEQRRHRFDPMNPAPPVTATGMG